jgi:hypothetical protein
VNTYITSQATGIRSVPIRAIQTFQGNLLSSRLSLKSCVGFTDLSVNSFDLNAEV